MQFHIYADNCHLYTTFEASDINKTALNMEILIDDIRGWYSDNMLELNDSGTEMMVISSKFCPSVHLDHIKIGESSISPSETVRNLGVIMDSNYTMVSHINHKVQESFLKIRGRHPTTLDIWQMNHPKLQSMLMSHQDLIIALVCSMVCLQNCLKTAKCYEHSCLTGRQNQKIWPYNSSASGSPLASYRITLQVQNSTFWYLIACMVWSQIICQRDCL